MCRFLCYRGPEILLADLLYRPTNSLIRQSFSARERSVPLNADGFGVGWYSKEVATPGVFTSVRPAWSNHNLRSLSEHMKSRCFFAHVRAASPGMRVSEANCHPFQFGRYLWMHNGTIADFPRIKRKLRAFLPDTIYNSIEGTTDSEHAFGVFLHLLGDTERICTTEEISHALLRTIARLESWSAEADRAASSYHNFAVTDGQSVATVRYVSNPTAEPASLYYSAGGKFECRDGICEFRPCAPHESTIIVASERLNDNAADWVRVAPNHILTVSPTLEVKVELIELARGSPQLAAV